MLLAIVVVAAGGYFWWQRTQSPELTEQGPEQPLPRASVPNETDPAREERQVDYPMVTIEMESGAEIKIELYPDVAPNTVANFVSLVRKGFYDGLTFHRIVPGFVIQGGDPTGTGAGGPGYTIFGEFTANGFPNNLRHTRGVISMARTQDPNSAGSQFFIMVADAPHLDGQYAAFGRVISGMDEVDRIVAEYQKNPSVPQRMARVTVEWDEEDVEPEKYSR